MMIKLKERTKKVIQSLMPELLEKVEKNSRQLEATRFLLGELHAARVRDLPDALPLADAEFKVFSQWGEDGIVEYLVSRIEVPTDTFVEFGVESYVESNTRFLLKHRNWSGLVLDSSAANIRFIQQDEIYWRHNITAVEAFISAENINDLIAGKGIRGDIGLLSIDIDGNDYWVWKAIEVIQPRIVICEYNSTFGIDHAVTIPYGRDFMRMKAHYSGLYYGASLRALCELADEKGYSFVGSNRIGGNAFFVRRDCMSRLLPLRPEEGYIPCKVRQSRDSSGRLTYLSLPQQLDEISGCLVYDLSRQQTVALGELGVVPRTS